MPHSSPGRGSRRVLSALASLLLAAGAVASAPVSGVVPPAAVAADSTFTDPHFAEFPVFTGLDHPTTVRFASDGRAFVAEKGGVVKEYDSVSDTTPTTVIDISSTVMNYWDRGLLGLALDPKLLSGHPYIYLFYADNDNAAPGVGAPATWPDSCPTPPGGTTDGCTVQSHLDRVQIDPATNKAVAGTRVNLVTDWCQQFPSHSGGGLVFGPDGQLYLTGGDGANFNGPDYGQRGGTLPSGSNPVTRVNPCNDPVTVTSQPGVLPITVNTATAEGGMLRSQDIRTSGDPVGLDGSLIRINPDTGAASSGNPLSGVSGASANAKRIIAHGFRNPYRITFRPGTDDLYIGDVGDGTWEEVNHLHVPPAAATPTTLTNFGWPCYEGSPKTSEPVIPDTDLCKALYAQSGGVTPPLYQYTHSGSLSPKGPCFAGNPNQTSSITGLAFYEGATGTTTPYPAKYDGALFFADYSRNCIAALLPGANGVPDPTKMEQIASNAGQPVDIVAGPGGDLYYVDHGDGKVMRIKYLMSPIARATASPQPVLAPATVHLDGSSSTDPNAGFSIDEWHWDLDHDGVFDEPTDATGKTVDWHITTPGVYPITLKVVSTSGLSDTVELNVDASDDPPDPVIDTPASSLTWAVGDTIPFSGHATDTEDGAIPAADLDWSIVMVHCPAGCHEHQVETDNGVASSSFVAPDHDYPSHLELRLTATDSHGAKTTTAVDLQPKTAQVSVSSSPTGVPISIQSTTKAAPWSATVIKGGEATVSAPLIRNLGGSRHRFSTWSDSHVRVRNLTVNGAISLKATYVPDEPDSCTSATTASAKQTWLSERSSGNEDLDWFEFHLAHRKHVVATLKDVPINLRLDLYRSCSNLLATSSHSGLSNEQISRTLSPGWYRIRVKAPGNGWSASPYELRFLTSAP